MRLNWKKIILIISFILAVILIGYFLYFLFLKPAIPIDKPVDLNINVPSGVLPPAGVNVNIPTLVNINGTLVPISEINVNIGPPAELPPGVVAPSETASGGLTKIDALTTNRAYQMTLASDGTNAMYYDKITGLFYKISPDGKTTLLSDKVFYEVEKVTWSPKKDKAVLEYPDGSNIVYDFTTKQQFTLPKHWKDFDFSPTGNELILKSIGTSPESSWLAISNTDGTNARKIEYLGNKDMTVHPIWSPNNQIIAMYREDLDADRQYLYFLGQNNENFKATIIEGRGFDGQWSKNGDRLLYSVWSSGSGFRPTLWIVDAQGNNIGQNRRNLGLETWVDKCTFADNSTIYCAVPTNLSEGAGLYRNDFDNSPSEIYKVDLTTGFKSKVAIPEGNHNIENLTVAQNGNYLYFVSKTDGRLYKINLR